MAFSPSRTFLARCDSQPEQSSKRSLFRRDAETNTRRRACSSETRDDSFLSLRLAGAKIALHFMKEAEQENQHAPLSYHGAWRIVWLVFLLIILGLILRALEPVILLFALVFLLAMVLNPIVVWLQKHHVPRTASVIFLVLALLAITATVIVFAIPPIARQGHELVHNAPKVWQGI